MRNLLVALVLFASRPAIAETPDPTTEQAAPSEERRPAASTKKPAPRPRPAAPAPKPSDTPRYEPAPRRPPLAEPFTPTRRDPAPAPKDEPVLAPRAEPVFTPREGPVFEPRGEPEYTPKDAPGFTPERDPASTERQFAPAGNQVKRPGFETPLAEPGKRAWDGFEPEQRTPREVDHRVHRPPSHDVYRHPHAHHGPPRSWYYHPCYASWWVHPYYRWMYGTIVIVNLPFYASAWDPYWGPPVRSGWMWVAGQWVGPYWYPGHWEPLSPAPYLYGSSYVYVPGFWWGGSYFEGYWRVADRPGFVWVDTRYVDRRPTWGHWRPRTPPVEDDYVWEPGFWNGEEWVEGFWRPESRTGFRWVSAAWDDSGMYHAGYWEPIEDVPGHVWIPGWFDGVEWVPGYWVTDREYLEADPESWTPPVEWDAGSGSSAPPRRDEAPLAIPVQ